MKTPFASCFGYSSTTRTARGGRRSGSAWRRIRGGRGCWSPTTDLAFRPSIASACSSGSTGPMPHVQVRTLASDLPSRAGSSPSITAGSSPARRPSGARRSSSTSRSYAVLTRGRHARGMFDIAADHAIGLYVGLLALPLALIAIQLRHPRDVSGTVLGASVLMAISGGIHLGLVLTHGNETITAALFVMNGIAYLALSQLYSWRWWRPASAALITMTLFGYLGYIVLGFDTPDQVALATTLLQLTALGLVLVPVAGERPWRRRRWGTLAGALADPPG